MKAFLETHFVDIKRKQIGELTRGIGRGPMPRLAKASGAVPKEDLDGDSSVAKTPEPWQALMIGHCTNVMHAYSPIVKL